MRSSRFLLLLALAAACAHAPAQSVTPSPTPGSGRGVLQPFVDSLIDVPDFRSAHWGILIADPGRGETLYAHNADKLFMPASNMKLVTAAVSLAQLGGDFRWTTTVFARGAVRDGALLGDMLIRGNGDPSMSAHMQHGDALAPLRAIADSLRAHGVTRIRGRLLAMASPFVDAPLGYGWAWDDLDEPYSAGVDALYFNEGFSEIVVHGGAHAGDPVVARTRPAATFPPLIIQARTVAAAQIGSSAADSARARSTIAVSQDSSHAGVRVAGTIAAGDSVVLAITHRDQSAAFLAVLREALSTGGIAVDGTVTDTSARADSLFSLRSPSLRETLPFFEKPSQNQIGELLLKTLAFQITGVGRADSGAKVVARQLAEWGATPDGFVIRDGSGLSRHDYLTPRTIVRVLDAITHLQDFRSLYDALPIAGVDGTTASRMKGTPAQGNLHAKTGTIDKARSLSGFVNTTDGRLLIFSALCNNFMVPTRRVDAVTDALSARLASLRLAP